MTTPGLPTEASPGAASPAGNSAPLDVLVVGASQSGLSMAWHLARRGVRYLLIDAAPEIGHSWRTRWDSLTLFTSAHYDGLPARASLAPRTATRARTRWPTTSPATPIGTRSRS